MTQKSVDVVDIQFKLYAKTKVQNACESIPNNISLLTASSAYGLLFVGEPEKAELKVFILNNLIDTENICNEILAHTVPLPGVPNNVVCSCDGSMLAVSYTQQGSAFLQIYSVPSFLKANINTLYGLKLCPEDNVSVLQLLWNPVISGNIAVVLTNGALGMYNLKDGGQIEMHSLDKSQQVQCGCWSPKGKQIVLGFANGKLQQFKPDLTPAKTIVCPTGVHAGPFSTIAVHWLSTFQFAAAFVQDGEDMIPSIYIINAPKGGTPSYINYFDVCYTTGQRANQVSFTHIQQWNLLLVISANGIEVGLLGCKESGETPTWVHYTLLDEARIEMPLTESKDETFPIGLAYDTSCTHQLIVNEKELPIMPMVHVLSTNGQLLSFNFLNLTPGALDVCSPPPPISYNTQQFRPLEEQLKDETADTGVGAVAVQHDKTPSAIPSVLVASTPVMKEKSQSFFGGLATTTAPQLFEQSSGFGNIAPATQTVKPVFSGFGGLGGVPSTGLLQIGAIGVQQQKLDQQQSAQTKPQTQPQPHLQQQQQQQQQLQQQQQHQKPQQSSTAAVTGVKSSELNKPLYTVPTSFTQPTIATTVQGAQPQKAQSDLAISSKMQSGFLELIAVQINSFDKEIKQLAAQSKGLLKNLGDPDEMRGCTKRLHDLQEIIEQANDHEFEMDVQNLRHFLNEARSMIAECRWKLEKYNNPDLPRVGNNSSDPINRRQLVKLQSYLSTNDAQLQVLKLQIDAQWSNFQDSVRRNSKSQIHIPCLDGIYQRMTKLKESLSRHRQKLNQIKVKLQQNGLLYKISIADTPKAVVKVESTIDSLADSILSVTLAQVVDEHRSKLSDEKLKAIREFTRQRQTVNTIKPQRPNRVGLKSEVVLETMLQSERIKVRENNATILASKEQPAQVADLKPSAVVKAEVTKPLALPTQAGSPAFSFSTMASNTFIKPMIPAEKHEKPAAASFSFKTPAAPIGFGMPAISVQAQKANIEPVKVGPSTPEDEVPGTAQLPISFAAKVISGTNTIPKNSPSIFAPTSTATAFSGFTVDALKSTTGEKEPKTAEEAGLFSFPTGTASTAGIFSGLAAAAAAAPNATQPQLFEVKSGTGFGGTFSFGGFTSSAGNPQLAKTTTVASVTPASTTVVPVSASKPTTGFFSGFGKSAGIENNAAPLNLSSVTSTSGPVLQNLTKSPQGTILSTIATSPTQPETVASSIPQSSVVTSASASSELPDSTGALLDSLTICKPTTKPTDLTKSPTVPGSIFAGLGESSGFSFTPVSTAAGGSIAELAKSLSSATVTITPVKVTATTASAATESVAPSLAISTAPTTIKEAMPATTTRTTTAAVPTSATSAVDVINAADFSFSLSSLGTTISTSPGTSLLTIATSTTSSTPIVIPTATTTSAASTIFSSEITTTTPSTVPTGLFANTAFPAVSAAAVSAAMTSTAAPNLFGGTSGGTSFFTSTATPSTTTTTSTGGSIFATSTASPLTSSFSGFGLGGAATTAASTPTTGVSLFSSPANAGNASPPNTNIFGGIPKPEQSLFGGAAVQSPTSGGNIFSNVAPNTSPFGATGTSPPPNQTVGGSIFGGGGGGDGFGKTGSSIFGGNAPAATVSPAVSSPFGGAVTTTVSPGGSIFGSSAVKPAEGGSIFSNAAVQPNATAGGGSIFGQSGFGQTAVSVAPATNLFGGGNTTQAAFGTGGSIFGGGAPTNTSGATSGGSIFGGMAAPAFGSPTSAPGSTGFGAFSQPNTGSPFSSPGASSGPFGQGVSVAQSGFGSPQQSSAFSKPIFGGPATFGNSPSFGGQPTFGGAPTFGTQKGFGSFTAAAPISPSTGVFGGGGASPGGGGVVQKNNLFETLGSSENTGLSFGNLAQNASAGGPKPPFGGSSFTSYRS